MFWGECSGKRVFPRRVGSNFKRFQRFVVTFCRWERFLKVRQRCKFGENPGFSGMEVRGEVGSEWDRIKRVRNVFGGKRWAETRVCTSCESEIQTVLAICDEVWPLGAVLESAPKMRQKVCRLRRAYCAAHAALSIHYWR